MSVLGNIMGAILGHGSAPTAAPAAAQAQVSASPKAAPAAPQTRGSASPTAAPAVAKAQTIDVAAIVDKAAASKGEKLTWRTSIVDLMKALGLDSSLAARKELAKELHYTGNVDDSAAMNVWLHKQVMSKLAENGGKVPADLLKSS
jgi:hypothetical protein